MSPTLHTNPGNTGVSIFKNMLNSREIQPFEME
jgi:hypothetical protein